MRSRVLCCRMDKSLAKVISPDKVEEVKVEPTRPIPNKVQQEVEDKDKDNDDVEDEEEDYDEEEDEENDDDEVDDKEEDNHEEDEEDDDEEDEENNDNTEDDEEDDEVIENHPSWLPDGWTMELNRGNDGTIFRYYTSPVSGITFKMKSEVLNYLFAEIDERFIESKDHCDDKNRLSRTHEWLPKGWMIEIRAGGDNMDKMYKFYVYPATGLRLSSKEDVLLYVNKMKMSTCDTDGKCDITSQNKIIFCRGIELFTTHTTCEETTKEKVNFRAKDRRSK